MRIPRNSALAAAAALLSFKFALAQTFTKCNPLHQSCPADPALGGSTNIDFTSGESSDFTGSGNGISYDSNGVALTVSQSGDSPTLTSNWYLMFGRVEIVCKAAPGTGIVSSAVMQSDDLDEIDWEWLGADSSQVQTNYFGKGYAGTYNRGANFADPTSQSDFNTYTIDWTPDQIVWQINGVTVRTLTPAASAGQYPQTPMQIKIGAWSGGDPSNSQGTIQWAGGYTDYSAGPYTFYVQSVAATDYSTGTSYSYSGTDGTWQQVTANGGSVMGGGSSASPVDTSAPAITSSSSGGPIPFSGTHQESSSYVRPTVYPWVPKDGSNTLSTSYGAVPTAIPGLPAGWTITSSGKVQPPSQATPPPAALSTSSPAASPSGAPRLAGGNNNVITSAPAVPTTLATATYSDFFQGGVAEPSSTDGATQPMYTGSASKTSLSSGIIVAICAMAGFTLA